MVEGIILGVLTYASMIFTFIKTPKVFQRILLKWKLFTDIGSMMIVYLLLGTISKSIVAIVGAILAGLLVGITLEVFERKNT